VGSSLFYFNNRLKSKEDIMTSEQAKRLEDFRSELHISHSQIFTYLNCSLKYYFGYVEGRMPEYRPAAMLFGSAIHAAIARYYKGVQKKGKPEPLSLHQDLFHDYWNWETEDTGIPIAYRGGNPTDFKLIGIVDCIQRDKDGNLIIIDNKTANRAYSQDKIEQDLQMTVYSYLAAASRLVPAKSDTAHRFDVLVKLKKEPRLDLYHTTRSAADRRRLAKTISRVLKGIEAGVFFPNASWMCTDCQHARACVNWST
jgi:putative RecB family exonuclease